MADDRKPEDLFSVVVPCRDDPVNVRCAVNSVLTAGGDTVEVLVVDDGSDPPLDPWADDRVRLLRHAFARGPGAARNTGIAAASGMYVMFCDSDDMFTADRVDMARELHARADVVICGQAWEEDEHRWTAPHDPQALLDATSPHMGATSVRRALCPDLDEEYLACEDIEWLIRLLAAEPAIATTGRVGYLVGRDDRPRLLNSSAARLEFSYRLLEQHADYYAAHHMARAFRWRRIARMERQHGGRWTTLRALGRSIAAVPTAGAFADLLRSVGDRRTFGAGQSPVGDTTDTSTSTQ